jgi:uncharacterized protein
MTFAQFCGASGKRVLLGYLALWAVATGYLAYKGADWFFPVFALLVFGLVFSALAWWLTRRSEAPAVAVVDPKRQSLWLLGYLAIYAVLVIGWGLGALKGAIAPGPAQEWAVLIYKLVFHVALPAALITWLGGSLRDTFDPGLGRRAVPVTLLVFVAISFAMLSLVSPSLEQIAGTGVKGAEVLLWIGAAWLWMSLEAGLTEEYLFRAGLQSRLTAWLESPLAAIVLACVLFGLLHAPGLFLRGDPDTDGWSTDPVQVIAFTIATLSPIGIMLAVLWARTRSLLLVVLIHGAIDALPHTAEMIATFR